MSQEAYAVRYNGYAERYEAIQARIAELQQIRAKKVEKADAIEAFIFELSERDNPITEFDDHLFMVSVKSIVVHSDGKFVFHFVNGSEA